MTCSTSCSSRALLAFAWRPAPAWRSLAEPRPRPAPAAADVPAATSGQASSRSRSRPRSRPPSRAAPHRPLPDREPLRLAAVPTRELLLAIEVALRQKLDLVGGDILEQFLSRHRLRWTGGLDAASRGGGPRRAGRRRGADHHGDLLAARPAADARPHHAARRHRRRPGHPLDRHGGPGGDDAPGLLGLGVIDDVKVLQEQLVTRLVGSLEAAATGRGGRAGPGLQRRPLAPAQIRYRSPLLDEHHGTRGRAPLPQPDPPARRRRGGGARGGPTAGRLGALPGARAGRGARRHAAQPAHHPGRRLPARPPGCSSAPWRWTCSSPGRSSTSRSPAGPPGPSVRFSVVGLDGGSGEVVWHSTSYGRGDDGVVFFGLGRIVATDRAGLPDGRRDGGRDCLAGVDRARCRRSTGSSAAGCSTRSRSIDTVPDVARSHCTIPPGLQEIFQAEIARLSSMTQGMCIAEPGPWPATYCANRTW